MSRVVERLFALNDACTGLMVRAHFLLSFKRPAVLDSSIDKICQKFVKKFPDFSASAIEKGPSYNYFKQHSSEIHDSLASYYYTLVDIVRVKEESLKLLHDVAGDLLDLTFDVARDLTIWFLELLTGTIQLLLLVDRLDDRKEFTIIFAYAYYFTQSTYEASYQKVSKFLVDFTNPIRQLQDECEQLSHRVVHTLLATGQQFTENGLCKTVCDKGYLNLFDNPERLSKLSTSEVDFTLQYLPRYRLWILYGFLVCPSALEKDEIRDMIRVALQFGLVIPIFRNVFLNIHEQYSALLASPLSKKLRLAKFKEIAKGAHIYAINDSVAEHTEARRFLRAQTSVLSSMLHEIPSLMSPKLPIVLAAISLCRQEVLWYFSHIQARTALNKDWRKWAIEEHFDDDYISELLFLIDQLSVLADQQSQTVADYYTLLFRQALQNFLPLADEMSREGHVTNYAQNLISSLSSISLPATSATMQGFRMNCFLLSSHLMSAQVGNRTPSAKSLIVHLNTLVFRSRCIDSLQPLVRQFGSLADLFFFPEQIKEAFTRNIHARGHIPRYCIVFVSIYGYVKQALHQLCPEEKVVIATESVSRSESNLQEICNHLGKAFQVLFSDVIEVAAQGGYPVNIASLPVSSPIYHCVRRIEYTRQTCANVCTAIRERQTIRIFDQELWTGQYLQNAIKDAIRTAFRGAALVGSKIERPSKFRFKCKIIFLALQELQNHIDVGFEGLLKEVLFDEFNDFGQGLSFSVPGQVNSVTKPIAECDAQSCGSLYVRFFASTFTKWVSLGQVVYSVTSMAFVSSSKCLNIKGKKTADPSSDNVSALAYDYLDSNELQAFCLFAGPHGVRALESRLLGQVQESTLEIKRCLARNHATLAAVSRLMAQPTVWLEAVKRLVGLDELFRHAVQIGSILKFRQLLFLALRQTTQARIGFLSSAISQIHRHHLKRDIDSLSPDLSISYLLHEISGDVSGFNDLNLQNALKPLKQSQEDEKIWQLMPCLFGLHYVCDAWSSALFDLSLGAISNSGHCIAECFRAVSNAIQAVQIDGVELRPEHRRDIEYEQKENLSSFLRFSSYTVFHMKQREASFSSHHLPSIRLFLQYFVSASESVEPSLLEDLIPFTVLRSDACHLNDIQMNTGVANEEDKDDE